VVSTLDDALGRAEETRATIEALTVDTDGFVTLDGQSRDLVVLADAVIDLREQRHRLIRQLTETETERDGLRAEVEHQYREGYLDGYADRRQEKDARFQR
jgi:hypothetical protein